MTASDVHGFGASPASPAKDGLKAFLRGSPRIYKLAEILYENSLYPGHILREGLVDAALAQIGRGPARRRQQPALTFQVPFPGPVNAVALIAWLRGQGVQVVEGSHTFYIPPQPAIETLLPDICAFYPRGSGFKVLRDLRHPRHARYLFKHRRSLRILARMIGTPHDQLVPANYMHLRGLGPRVWDLACWSWPQGCCSVFVVDHASGRAPNADEAIAFLKRLLDVTRRDGLRVLIPRWQSNEDFRPPTCNGNLIFDESLGHAQYLDFQNFGVVGPRRSTGTLEIALDVTSTDGALIANSLVAGAAWAHGWCDAGHVGPITKWLFLRGLTRFTLHEERAPSNLLNAVPSAGIRSPLDRAVVVSPQ
jgi:hypothetical protein